MRGPETDSLDGAFRSHTSSRSPAGSAPASVSLKPACSICYPYSVFWQRKRTALCGIPPPTAHPAGRAFWSFPLEPRTVFHLLFGKLSMSYMRDIVVASNGQQTFIGNSRMINPDVRGHGDRGRLE